MQHYTNKWLVLIGLLAGTFVLGFDYTIVSIALPNIQENLGGSFVQTQWLINIFMLMLCILMASMGRLGDIIGSLKLLNIGWLVLIMSSILAGLAKDPAWLITWRAWQGVAIAIIVPNSLSLISHSFPEKEIGLAMGWWMLVLALGFAVGPVLGAVLCHLFSWRYIFFINAPFVLISLIFGLFTRSQQHFDPEKSYIDWRGMMLLAVSIGCFVLFVVEAPFRGWTNWLTLSLLIIAVIAFFLLYRVEKKLDQPLICFAYFKNLLFASCVLTNFCLLVFLISAFFLLPFYLYLVQHYSTLSSGLILLPVTLVMAIVSPFAGNIASKARPSIPILTGIICILIAALVMTQFSVHTSFWLLLLAFIPFGIAWGFVFSATAPIAIGALPPNTAGIATGMLWGIQNIGAALGLAITGTVFRLSQQHYLYHQLKQAGVPISEPVQHFIHLLLINPHQAETASLPVSHQMHQQLLAFANTSFVDAFHVVMSGLVIFTFLLLIVVMIFLQKLKQQRPSIHD